MHDTCEHYAMKERLDNTHDQDANYKLKFYQLTGEQF